MKSDAGEVKVTPEELERILNEPTGIDPDIAAKYIYADAGEVKECEHKKTQIWEPHLAGARKCNDCGMVYNPNRNPQWFFEGPSVEERLATCLELASDLDLYTSHTKRCETYTNYPNSCTCGLGKIREALAKVKHD